MSNDTTTSNRTANPVTWFEIHTANPERAKTFYGAVFGWTFEDYGDRYASFNCGNLTGGFAASDSLSRGGALIVLYARNLVSMQRRIVEAGGKIVRETFEFPGGRRFHFTDVSGTELAVWSDQ